MKPLALVLLLAACAPVPEGQVAPELTAIDRYCNATTPIARATIRRLLNLGTEEIVCPPVGSTE